MISLRETVLKNLRGGKESCNDDFLWYANICAFIKDQTASWRSKGGRQDLNFQSCIGLALEGIDNRLVGCL